MIQDDISHAAAPAGLRRLPQVQRLLETSTGQDLLIRYPRPAVLHAIRAALVEARTTLRAPNPPDIAPDHLLATARRHLEAAPRLRRVINATGIVLHTNLGRAPLAPEAIAAVIEAAGACTLEFDLTGGGRGSRTQAIEPLLRRLTGAEAALAVNNCAAAVLLALSALAAGGEVIVSRGELVEIGGGFRIPDVIQQGGARLVEIGTTNKTRIDDYRRAITPATRVLLKVHRSNFRVTGFTEAATLPELAALARETGLLLVEDLGSGALHPLPGLDEPTVPASIAAGADLVIFSGDKLMGGPQSGLLVGRTAAIDPLRRHPLLRALRLDKLVLAALEATLRLHDAAAPLPVTRMLSPDPAATTARAAHLANLLPGTTPEPSTGYAGGGTLSGIGIRSAALAIPTPDPEATKAALRHGTPPVIARIAEGRLLLDLLAVPDEALPELVQAIKTALAP